MATGSIHLSSSNPSIIVYPNHLSANLIRSMHSLKWPLNRSLSCYPALKASFCFIYCVRPSFWKIFALIFLLLLKMATTNIFHNFHLDSVSISWSFLLSIQPFLRHSTLYLTPVFGSGLLSLYEYA